MGARMKKFRASPEQVAKCRRNIMGLHRNLLLVHGGGLICVGLFGLGLMAYHLMTKA